VLVPYFLLFLCFIKVTQEIFSELDETKAKFPIFSTRDGVRSKERGGPEGSHTTGWHGSPPGRAKRWYGPLVHPLTSPFCLYILLDEKNLRTRTLFVGVLDTGVSRSTCSWAPSTDQLRPRGGTMTEASGEDPHEEVPHEENND
jgi:hypothetical protein